MSLFTRRKGLPASAGCGALSKPAVEPRPAFVKLLGEKESMRRLPLGGLVTPDVRRLFAAGLVLLAIVVWLHMVSWPSSWGGNYALEGDGARYVQMAIQMSGFDRLGNMPELGRDLARVLPPLLPMCIALSSLVTGEYYYSAHATEAATLLLAVGAAFLLGRSLSKSSGSALCA